MVRNKENWKQIPGYENEYFVSTEGEVYSTRLKRNLKKSITASGYHVVTLRKNNVARLKTVHRLVFTTFVHEAPEDINHKDGNKLNNILDNLEACSRSYNMKHAYHYLGASPGKKKLTPGLVKWVKEHLNVISTSKISSLTNIPRQTLNDVRDGRTWHRKQTVNLK